MFKNSTVDYEQVKVNSFDLHLYIRNNGSQFEDGSCRPELWKYYDADDRGMPTNIDVLNQAENTKTVRMNWNRHYTYKVKPKWQRLITRPSGTEQPAAVYSGGPGDCPYWDCADLDTKFELGDMTKSANCWKIIIYNPGTETIQFRAYYTCLCTFEQIFIPHIPWMLLQSAKCFLSKRRLKMLNLSDLGRRSMNDIDL